MTSLCGTMPGRARSSLLVLCAAAMAFAVTLLGAPQVRAQPRAAAGDPAWVSLLQDSDLPPGATPDAVLTGAVSQQRAGSLGLGQLRIGPDNMVWSKAWQLNGQGQEVVELVVDTGTAQEARQAVAGAHESSAKTAHRFGADRNGNPIYARTQDTSGGAVLICNDPFSRSRFFFVVETVAGASSPQSEACARTQHLAEVQQSRVGDGVADAAGVANRPDLANTAGRALGALVGYLLLINGIAWLRDRERVGGSWRRFKHYRAPDGDGLTDVLPRARAERRRGVQVFALQLLGVSIMFLGIPGLQPFWYVFVLAGLFVIRVSERYLHPSGAPGSAPKAQRPSLLPRMALTTAGILVVLGFLIVVAGSLSGEESDRNRLIPSSQASAQFQSSASGLLLVGVFLLGVSAILVRVARRRRALNARQMMQRDPRPPVLFLRSFGDDELRLRSATLGRAALIEKLSLGRFDRFEEVLVRCLAPFGPVVALNPPGTRLAPLGAARETLAAPPEVWQPVVADWLNRSSTILVALPPEKVTPGLIWELNAILHGGHWHKVIIVLPPLRAEELRARWAGLSAAVGNVWPFSMPLPADPAELLALRPGNDAWRGFAAPLRNEWTYRAALLSASSLEVLTGSDPANGSQPMTTSGPTSSVFSFKQGIEATQ